MPEPIVYLNGEFLPPAEAKINIYDFGIVLGATLTEMTRTFRHRPFKLDEHLDRLYRSLKYAYVDPQISKAEMKQRTLELIEHNSRLVDEDGDIAVIHFVTPGEARGYAGGAGGGGPLTPTVCIHSFPLRFEMWRKMFAQGAHVVTPAVRHVPPQSVDSKTKNRSRLHFWIAGEQAHGVDPEALPLLLDLDGNITETTGTNFVVVKGQTIYSPTSRNILQGVSLQTVRELAPRIGLGFEERDMQPYDVINADEAWLTTTPYCVAPVTKINNIPIGDGSPGPLHNRMMQAWSDLVGVDVLDQIKQPDTAAV